MRFVADAMLGTLAKWLRVLGHDVVYVRDMNDAEILSLAGKESRVILSRDAELCRAADSLYISSTDLDTQLKAVLERWPPDPERVLSRCLECNSLLERASGDAVREKVPDGVLSRHNDFWRCPGCGRVYWQGSHYDDMMRRVSRLGIRPGP